MRIVKYLSLLFLLLAVLGYMACAFLFDNNICYSKYTGFINLSKKNIGGVVYNETSKTIKVTDYLYVKKIPPHKNSKSIGVFDADSLIIDRPMYFENKKYDNKVFKFCDLGKFRVIENKGKIIIHPMGAVWFCKLVNDFDFYDSIDEAFN